MSLTPDVICLLPFLPCFNLFQMSLFMGVIYIEHSETRVKESSSDHPVSRHVEISWMVDSVICLWCLNCDINSSQYFGSCILLYDLKPYHPSNALVHV